MSNNSFVQIFRDLLRDPSVTSLPPSYRCVLFTLLDYACYSPCKQDDHGVLIDLLPGQFMCTIRGLADLANVGKNDAERALAKFVDLKIVRQEVRRKKTIVTILWGLKQQKTETTTETRKRQERDTKEEVLENKNKNTTSSSPPKKLVEGAELDKTIFLLIDQCKKLNLPFSKGTLLSVFKETSGSSVQSALNKFQKRPKHLKPLDYPDTWLRKNAKIEHDFELQKKEAEGKI
jgi:DNA-binding transcriptional regulator YhcF (GntR family)